MMLEKLWIFKRDRIYRYFKRKHTEWAYSIKKKKEQGVLSAYCWVIKEIYNNLVFIFGFIFSIPIAIMLLGIRPIMKVKLVMLHSSRIGHYAQNTELLLCFYEQIEIKEKYKILYF